MKSKYACLYVPYRNLNCLADFGDNWHRDTPQQQEGSLYPNPRSQGGGQFRVRGGSAASTMQLG
jgi:hypothetical protein